MRSRSSKQGSNKEGTKMEIEKLKKLKEEPQLSGAYIRSLVKQLTSSRTKDPSPLTNPKISTSSQDIGDLNDNQNQPPPPPPPPQNLTKISNSSDDQTQQKLTTTHNPQQPPHKKQVRRRLHTSRPYQERLLNMAEARREIVTALKFHRASMKQANEQKPPPPPQSPPPPPPPPPHESLQNPSLEQLELQERTTRCRRNPRIYPSNTNINFSNYLENLHCSSSFSCPLPPPNNTNVPYFCPSLSPPLPIIDNLTFTLPHQPLGLNLNFHDFNNLDTTFLYHQNTTTTTNNQLPSIYSYSSPSSSSTSPTFPTNTEEVHSLVTSPEEPFMISDVMDTSHLLMNEGLHHMVDDDEMAEIRSIGEQHEMEWNDKMNLVTSARWFKFLKKMEINPEEDNKNGSSSSSNEEDGFNDLFDEVMEFPSWMNTNNNNNNNESFFLQQHLNDNYSEDYLQEPALPCMDIGEIDVMEGEWLA